jgi:hypothetical protein
MVILYETAPPKGSFKRLLDNALGRYYLTEDFTLIKVLKIEPHNGYELRTELWDQGEHGPPNAEPLEIINAYTKEGDLVGDPNMAKEICDKRGIKPQMRTSHSNCCTIGYCPKDEKYYGWSHRAIFGYGIGDKIGDELDSPSSLEGNMPKGFQAKNLEDAKLMAMAFAKSVS